jgi:hypothetical protein
VQVIENTNYDGDKAKTKEELIAEIETLLVEEKQGKQLIKKPRRKTGLA